MSNDFDVCILGYGVISSQLVNQLSSENKTVLVVTENLSNDNFQENVTFISRTIFLKKAQSMIFGNVVCSLRLDYLSEELFIKLILGATLRNTPNLILMSSGSVYGETLLPVTEEVMARPESTYAKSRLNAEEIVLRVVPPSTNLVILRISNVYGHPDLEDFVNQSWRSHYESRRQTVYQSGLIYRDFIHIDDLIKVICILLVRSQVDRDIFNISTGISLSAEEVLEIVQDLQAKGHVEIVSASKPLGILDRSILDSSKAIKALSWVPRNPKQGITEYYSRLSSKSFE